MTRVPRAQHANRRRPPKKATSSASTVSSTHKTNAVDHESTAFDRRSSSSAHEPLQRFVDADHAPKKKSALDVRTTENDELDGVFRTHMADFRTALHEMIHQPPSVVFFGGARLRPGDPYWDLALSFGASGARRGIPPKTGRGPGAMEAVPEGFIAWRDAHARVVQSVVGGVSRLSRLDDQRTLGFNIHLKHEQAPTPFVENGAEIENFAFRKFALYENVRGVVVMPGGFGTLDELLEVLVLRHNGKTRDPIVLAGKAYWQPIVDAWKTAAQRNGTDLLAGMLDDVLVTDDPEEAMDFIERADNVRSFDEEPHELYKKMTREIRLARYVASTNAPAVAVLGGNKLADDDPARAIVADVARRVSDDGGAVRVGEDGPIATSISAAVKRASDVQRVFWDPTASKASSTKKASHFSERVPHKEAFLRNASAYVVLPDADRGKDELCTVLCQIQTAKIERRPIVLVDSSYWRPIMESWHAQMIGENHAYIAEDDMNLVTYADNADDVMRALS